MAKRSDKAKGAGAGKPDAVAEFYSPPAKSGKLTGAEAAAAAAAMFDTAQPKSVAFRAQLPVKLSGLVETTFNAVPDPDGAYAELIGALDRRDLQTLPVLRDALGDTARLYRQAHLLYITAYAEQKKFEVSFDQVVGSMREEALRELEQDKQLGLKTKQITNDDVLGRVSTMYPDEWNRLSEMKVRAGKTIEHLLHLVEVFKARHHALTALVTARKEL